jgi:hypothetical protein
MNKNEFRGININWSQYPNGLPVENIDEYVKNLLKLLVDEEEDWQLEEPDDFADFEKTIQYESALFEEMISLEVVDSMVVGQQEQAFNAIMHAYHKNK